MVELKKITAENLAAVLGLNLSEDQRGYVSSVAESLAQAYVYAETAFPFAVCCGQDIVGFIMMGFYREKGYYTLWKLLIDQKHQRMGYGRKALELGISFLKDHYHVHEIYTGVLPQNTVAAGLYESVGFVRTGVHENGMDEMRLEC